MWLRKGCHEKLLRPIPLKESERLFQFSWQLFFSISYTIKDTKERWDFVVEMTYTLYLDTELKDKSLRCTNERDMHQHENFFYGITEKSFKISEACIIVSRIDGIQLVLWSVKIVKKKIGSFYFQKFLSNQFAR